MPLISSPIDGSPMREVERFGVKMDICPTSGGIWLDKGELEKIIMMIREEGLRDGGGQGAAAARAYSEQPAQHREPRSYDERPPRRKKDSIFDNIMDIFD